MKIAADNNQASLTLHGGEAWCLFGTNRSAIEGVISEIASSSADSIELLSFQKQQEIFEDELKKDDTDFLDRIDPGTPASAFIGDIEKHQHIIHAFNLQHCLTRGYRQLSSGESRKLLLLAAISRAPSGLILQNPFDGIDKAGCIELNRILRYLHENGYTVIITVNNYDDIPEWCDNLAMVEGGTTVLQGKRREILPQIQDRLKEYHSLQLQLENGSHLQTKGETFELVRLRNGFSRYGETSVFSGVDLTIKTGDHTLITGPNGSGKSTLLHILCGDNQDCYANDLKIMGIRRGSGESIWELKRHIGIVTPEMHRNHYIPGSALQVVLSGFFDSIGVYTQYGRKHKKEGERWLAMIGVFEKARSPFRSLSYAEQRLCLIARALIKLPPLLILDEPTQGLDQQSRNEILDFLELIAEKERCTILYASHRENEFRSFFKQHLDLSRFSCRLDAPFREK